MEQILERTEEKMQKTLNALTYEFSMIRAGRANPKLLDKITVSYYGAPSPLQQVANISVPEARMILIQPWDRTLIKEINKVIYPMMQRFIPDYDPVVSDFLSRTVMAVSAEKERRFDELLPVLEKLCR